MLKLFLKLLCLILCIPIGYTVYLLINNEIPETEIKNYLIMLGIIILSIISIRFIDSSIEGDNWMED